MAFQLACGRPPFEANNISGLWLQHLDEPAPPLDAQVPVPEGFDRWVDTLLAKEPARRFQCAADAAWNLLLLGDVEDEEVNERPPMDTTSIGQAETWAQISIDKNIEIDPLSADTRVEPAGAAPTSEAAAGSKPREVVQTSVALESLWADSGESPGLWAESSLVDEEAREEASSGSDQRERTDPRGISLAEHAKAPDYEMPAFVSRWEHRVETPRPPDRHQTSLGLIGLRQPAFVGRQQARDSLWDELSKVFHQRTTRAVVVDGLPGVGKRRLVRWFARRVRELGLAKVVRIPEREAFGAGDELRLALRDYLRTWGLSRHECRQRVRAHFGTHLQTDDAELSELIERVDMPALAQIMVPDTSASARREPEFQFAEPTQKWSVISRFLSLEAALRPLIIWIDGATDRSESIDLVRYLLHREELTEMGCLVVISMRGESESGRRESRFGHLAGLVDSDKVVRLDIESLPSTEQRAVIADLIDMHPDLVDAIQAHAGGSVAFAVHLVSHLVERGALRASEHGYRLGVHASQAFPDSLGALWEARLVQAASTFSETDQIDIWAAMEAAAALGQSINREEWRELVEQLDLVVPERLWDELSRQGLASATPTGWLLREESLRYTLEQCSRRRGRWQMNHAAIAHMLSSRSGSATALRRRAHHLRQAGQAEAALGPLRDAARELMRDGSFAQARTCLNHYRQTVESHQFADDDLRHTADLAMQADLARIIGRPDDVRRWARKFFAAAAHVDDRNGLATILYVLAEMARLDGEIERGVYFYRHAHQQFQQAHDIAGQVKALSGEGWLRGVAGESELAEVLLKQAIDTGEQLRTREVRCELAWCYQGLGEISWFRGQLDRAMRLSEKAETLALEVGAPVYVGMARRLAADVSLERGDTQTGWRSYRNALDMLAAVNSRLADLARVGSAVTAMEEGRFDAAERLLTPLEQVARLEGRYAYRLLYHGGRLPLLARHGAMAVFDAEFAEVSALSSKMSFVFPYLARSMELAAHILGENGHLERSARLEQLGRDQWQRLGRSA